MKTKKLSLAACSWFKILAAATLPTALTASMLVVGLSTTSPAAELPIALTGWSQDVIAENTATSPAAGTSIDYQGTTTDWVWYEHGAPNSTQGLPVSRTFVSEFNPNVIFQYQPYTGNNAILESGTVTLTAPAEYKSLAFLVSTQGGGSVFQATLHFSDGSSAMFNTSANPDPDWTQNAANNAISNIGLLDRTNAWSGFYTGTLNMFEHDFQLPLADQTKNLVSIDFLKTAGNHDALFAVSGQLTVPEPASLVLFGLGAAGLFVAVRRRRKN